MSTITTIASGDAISASRSVINTNFSNLNTDKAELSGATFIGDISVPAEVYGAGWNGSNEVPTKNDLYDKIETLGSGSVATDAIWDAKGDLAGGTGANTASRLAVGTNGQVLTADSAEVTGLKWSNPAGGGDALTSGTLAQFAATTSLQLKGVISDETGSGSLVFATSPTLVTPALGVATATSINGASIISGTLNGSVTGTNTGDQTTIVGITGTKAQFDTAVTDGNIVYSGDSPTLGTITTTGNIELGNASDTTISRVSAGVIAVEGSTVPTLSVGNTWTATQTEKAVLYTNDAINATGNAATIPITHRFHTVTNNSAATLTITLTTSGATDGQLHLIRVYDFSAVAQTVAWVNTENGEGTAFTTSNGSTTLPRTAGFMYNSSTSKWRCLTN